MKVLILITLCVLTFQLHLSYIDRTGQGIYVLTSNILNNEALNGIEASFDDGLATFNGCNTNVGVYQEEPGNLVTFTGQWIDTERDC